MRKKLLMLNRRCIKNPLGGGAELYTHEIFKRLVDEYEITYVTSIFEGGKPEEILDDITYIRAGSEISMHVHGFLYYMMNRNNYDLIIDQFNGLGFLTFLSKNSIMLIHQLYDEFWVAKLGNVGYPYKYVEKFLLSLYKKKNVIAVSQSTKDDLLLKGYIDENIDIVYNGIDYIKYPKKEQFIGTKICYLGRMEKTKNPEDVLKVFNTLKKKIPNLELNFVGGGEENHRLQKKYGNIEGVTYNGFVSETKKYEVLRESDLLVVPSIREGWGQIVIQANMVGTPVVGYRVAGIKDSVLENVTGELVYPKDIKALTETVYSLLIDKQKLEKYSTEALVRAEGFSWDNSAEEMRKRLESYAK